jgi:hypothetical protein
MRGRSTRTNNRSGFLCASDNDDRRIISATIERSIQLQLKAIGGGDRAARVRPINREFSERFLTSSEIRRRDRACVRARRRRPRAPASGHAPSPDARGNSSSAACISCDLGRIRSDLRFILLHCFAH